MTDLNVFCSEVEGNARAKIKNAWIYWREGSQKLILRADDQGRVLKFTSGDPKKPASYQEAFVTKEGVDVKVAYSNGDEQFAEDRITERLTDQTTKQALSATLAAIGPVKAAPGAKTTVKVLPLAEIKLPKRGNAKRALVVTTFGGTPDDVHARNMDKFLLKNYGEAGKDPKLFRGDEERGFREELRRVVKASGQAPLNIIADVETAAKAVAKDDADERIVALTLHGNVDRIGRRLSGLFLVESTLQELDAINADFKVRKSALEKAKANFEKAKSDLASAKADLAKAKASGKKADIDKAQKLVDQRQETFEKTELEVQSRQENFDAIDPDAREMLLAFSKAADALKASGVETVELQACDAGGGPAQIASLGFLGKLKKFFSAPGHPVEIKAHPKAIFTLDNNGVTVWVGAATDKDKPGVQKSTTSLPLP